MTDLCRKPGKAPAPYPYYRYDELRPGWIRLLQLKDVDEVSFYDRERPLRITLTSFPIDAAPAYLCLSYTWGGATLEAEKRTEIFCQERRCYPVACDNRLVLGTRNLRDALVAIRYCQWARSQRHDLLSEEDDEDLGGPYVAEDYIWIDAICIDQNDLTERASQVAQMGTIYRNSRSCIIWLGKSDPSTRVAINICHNIANVEQKEGILQKMKPRDDNPLGSQHEFAISVGMLDEDERIAMAMFFSRTYFSRLWTIQEAILAPKAVVLCGPLMLSYDTLLIVGRLFCHSATSQFWSSAYGDATRRGLSPPQMGEVVSCAASTVVLTGISYCRSILSSNGMPDFMSVLGLSNTSQATEPRDKIYAIRAIAGELDQIPLAEFPVDYTVPVDTLYLKATIMVASRTASLEFLYAVCPYELYNYASLPTWCPDYSAASRPMLVSSGGAHRGWSTGRLWQSRPELRFQSRTMIVSGFCYDKIHSLAFNKSSDRDGEWAITRLLSLVADLRWREVPASAYRSDTRVKVLCRLLSFRVLEENAQYPDVFGLMLPVLCAFSLHRAFIVDYGASDMMSLQPSKTGAVMARHKAFNLALDRILALEPESEVYLPQKLPEAPGSIFTFDSMASILMEQSSIVDRAQRAGLEADLDRFVPASQGRAADITATDIIGSYFFTMASNVVLKTLVGHCIFSTGKSERLGWAAMHCRSEDEIWYLHGASGPCILRSRDDGSYEFVGMAYIEGLMYGQIADEPGVEQHPRRSVCII